jgi:hypothetical protein
MITCQLCNKQYKSITNSHLKSHKITFEEYLEKFPGAKTISEETSKKYSENTKRYNASRDYSEMGKKISETKKKMYASGELIQWNTGLNLSQEHKDLLSKIVTEAYASGERVHWNTGLNLSQETKDQIAKTCAEYELTDEQKQNHLDAMKKILSSPDYVPPMLGKFHSQETKDQISNALLEQRDQIRATMEAKGRWIPLNELDDFTVYKRLVWSETNKNVHLIPNYDETKRGLCKINLDNYQVDHIISITNGFKLDIPPEILGSVLNLQFIPWRENLEKFSRSDMTIKELYELIEKE